MSDLKLNFNIKVMHSGDRVRIMFDFPVAWIEIDKPQAEKLAALIHAHAIVPLPLDAEPAPLPSRQPPGRTKARRKKRKTGKGK